jgi:hypothetical protein
MRLINAHDSTEAFSRSEIPVINELCDGGHVDKVTGGFFD